MAHKVETLRGRLESVSVHVDASKEFTTAVILLNVNGTPVHGLGVAKRNRQDDYNEEIGFSLAIARALIDAGDNLEQTAYEVDALRV